MRLGLLILSAGLTVIMAGSVASQTPYLYKARLVQAAPGRLLDVIDLVKAMQPGYKEVGDEAPFVMRHSQGDHWDLLLLFPIKSYSDYYSAERVAKRKQQQSAWSSFDAAIAWQEDVFVFGPPLDDLKTAFAAAGFFHVEMFHSLPAKQAELFKEREMENAYQKTLKRPENFIFVRDQGAAWDLFTIGTYRDLKHYAESAGIPESEQEAAAKAAGFEAASRIGPYLRTLISSHHDTLAVSIK